MSTGRDEIIAALSELETLGGYRIVRYWRGIDLPAVPTLLVRVDRIRPRSTAAAGVRVYGAAVLVVSRHTDPDRAEAELDAALEDVLDAIETTDTLPGWDGVERVTLDDKFHAYEITLTVPIRIERPTP